MAEDREVGGIRCMQVLAALERLVDGDIEPELRERVTAHVGGCDNCANFGAAYGELVGRLRGLSPPPPTGRIRAQVMARIRAEAQPTSS